jgi:hypothetical protein
LGSEGWLEGWLKGWFDVKKKHTLRVDEPVMIRLMLLLLFPMKGLLCLLVGGRRRAVSAGTPPAFIKRNQGKYTFYLTGIRWALDQSDDHSRG